MTTAESFVELLEARASGAAKDRGYHFLGADGVESSSLSFEGLKLRARAVSVALREEEDGDGPVVLLFPPGLDFVVGFIGCLYGGRIAVPAYPPGSRRTRGRLRSILRDAKPTTVLTTEATRAKADSLASRVPELEGLRWIATDAIDDVLAEHWKMPRIGPEDPAFLQYTSGSTSAPKGVVVGHGNLLENEEMIRRAFGQSEESVVVSWLPPYHDMGLIGTILQPLYVGGRCILMSPSTFLRRPVRWLEAMDAYRATTSGGPDFAYDLAVRKVPEERLDDLDLSSWKVAFNGSEPIRAETLHRFTQKYERCGFSYEAFVPCYGLAEATLFVTGGPAGREPRVETLESAALEQHRVEPATGEGRSVRVVSSGRLADRNEIAIVDPASRKRCEEGRVGEIWIAGPTVAGGYWDRPEQTEETFRAKLDESAQEGRESQFLRTGDLGFLADGELFVTGRLKDLIIVRGRNLHPHDLERVGERSHAAVQPGGVAAFSVDDDGVERVILAVELIRGASAEPEAVGQAVRRAVGREMEVDVSEALLLKPGGLPRTSSGKHRRGECRSRYLREELPIVCRSRRPSEEVPRDESELSPEELLRLSATHRTVELRNRLVLEVARAGKLPPTVVEPEESLPALGLDSLQVVDLQHRLEADLGVHLSLEELLGATDLEALTLRIESDLQAGSSTTPPPVRVGSETGLHPTSHGQRALWYLQRLAPESAAYNIPVALRLREPVDSTVLRRSFEILVERHPALRTTLESEGEHPRQLVHSELAPSFRELEIDESVPGGLQETLCREAYRPFDLEAGPLVRLALLRDDSEGEIILLVVHHVVCDFWSLEILARELAALTARGARTGGDAFEDSPRLRYSDYVRWQKRLLAGGEGERLWGYWREQLRGPLPELSLPSDRPRPTTQSFRGGAVRTRLQDGTLKELEKFAREQEVTLFVVLLAGFIVLLHRYSGQTDLIVGSPTAGRSSEALQDMVGYFVNPLPLRVDLSGEPTFEELVHRVGQGVLEVFKHGAFPFALMAERLQPARDPSRSPVFQVLFLLQQPRGEASRGLAAAAVGQEGARFDLGGLPVETFHLEERAAQFDLNLTAARLSPGLGLRLQFSVDLFDPTTAWRLLDHLGAVLRGALARPDTVAGKLPLLTAAERHELLVSRNDTAQSWAETCRVDQLFAQRAELQPEARAVIFENHEFTFGELLEWTVSIAERLRALGVGVETPVAICLERSPALVAAMLGVLRAGGHYVPMDPAYPDARLDFMLADAGAEHLITSEGPAGRFDGFEGTVLRIDAEDGPSSGGTGRLPPVATDSRSLAYVIYTSGSTGRPKGVQVSHRSLTNFFDAMDSHVPCGPDDTMLAVTSISFDISALELLWALTRGARVVLLGEDAVLGGSSSHPIASGRGRAGAEPDLSLFYFASTDTAEEGDGDRYRLLLDGARFADRAGFRAVWTPERHFHSFGGLYPNPSVTGAALATITERVAIRAGSVVLPLHHPIRVAEEWSVVDNLSRGRVGLAFASGWHADDFVFYPENYPHRKEVTFEGIETVRQLWRGEPVRVRGGGGNELEVEISPPPIQAELPVWITAAGNPATFETAGEMGANVLTHLLGQSVQEVAEKLELYRRARRKNGYDPETGRVTMMLHTHVAGDDGTVRDRVREPFKDYLRSSLGLIRNLLKSLDMPLELDEMDEQEMDDLLDFAFARYYESSSLMGDPESCLEMIDVLAEIGVDEVACLIDFGVDSDVVLESLEDLAALQSSPTPADSELGFSLSAQAARWRPTILQCTPSTMRLLSLDERAMSSLRSVESVLLGGEVVTARLAGEAADGLGAKVFNVYGPTETTIWSSIHRIDEPGEKVPLGRPLANTSIYVLDPGMEPVPRNVAGEIHIGGAGLARGYRGRTKLTAERFVPDPFAAKPGRRLYRTGDLARVNGTGDVEFLGRLDHQVKVRGFRVELGEIETVLEDHPSVVEAAVVARDGPDGSAQLTAHFAPAQADPEDLRGFLGRTLPPHMIPQELSGARQLPRMPNGKIDRRSLSRRKAPERSSGKVRYVEPQSGLEREIAAVWRRVLDVDRVGAEENFFDLGGHSLLMAQAHRELRGVIGSGVELVKLLEHPTVKSLARYVTEQGGERFSRGRVQQRARKQKEQRRRRRRVKAGSKR